MFLLIKHADDVAKTFKKVAVLELEKEIMLKRLTQLENELHICKGIIAGLEIERDQLDREVQHWQSEFIAMRDKHESRVSTEGKTTHT